MPASVVQIEAAFQIEDGFQSRAQIFRAAQTPSAVLDRAAFQFPVAVPAAGRVDLTVRISNARVYETVERDAALRMGRAGEREHRRRAGYKQLVHLPGLHRSRENTQCFPHFMRLNRQPATSKFRAGK